jgi:hypothetical protein
MARITGHVISLRIGRLVANADYDSAEKVMTFKIPSTSRKDRAYVVEVDLLSCEVACKCEAFSDFREAHLMPYRRENAAAPLEVFARAKGYGLLPLITRAPRNLCPHSRKVQRWLKRHGHFEYFQLKEQQLMEKVEGLPNRNEKRGAA